MCMLYKYSENFGRQLALLYSLVTLIHALKDSFHSFFASTFWSSFLNISESHQMGYSS